MGANPGIRTVAYWTVYFAYVLRISTIFAVTSIRFVDDMTPVRYRIMAESASKETVRTDMAVLT